MGGVLEVGNSAIRHYKNRERKILAFKMPPFKTSSDFDFEPSEILSIEYRNWKGLNFCGWMETGKHLKIKGGGLGFAGYRWGRRGKGREGKGQKMNGVGGESKNASQKENRREGMQ